LKTNQSNKPPERSGNMALAGFLFGSRLAFLFAKLIIMRNEYSAMFRAALRKMPLSVDAAQP